MTKKKNNKIDDEIKLIRKDIDSNNNVTIVIFGIIILFVFILFAILTIYIDDNFVNYKDWDFSKEKFVTSYDWECVEYKTINKDFYNVNADDVFTYEYTIKEPIDYNITVSNIKITGDYVNMEVSYDADVFDNVTIVGYDKTSTQTIKTCTKYMLVKTGEMK